MEEEQASSRRNKAGNQTRWSLSFSPDETRTIARQSSCGHLHLTFSTPQKSSLKGKKGCFISEPYMSGHGLGTWMQFVLKCQLPVWKQFHIFMVERQERVLTKDTE